MKPILSFMCNFSFLIIFQPILLDIITRNGRWIVTNHSKDDDFYSTIFFIAIVVIIFIIVYLYEAAKRNKKSSKPSKPSSFFQALENIYDIYCYIVGGGCLILLILSPIAVIISLFSGNNKTKQHQRDLGERKDSTRVYSIISDTDFMQSHIAGKNEFQGNDTLFYYESRIYQNKTGKELTKYAIKYEPKGNHTLEVIEVIKPNQYFNTYFIALFEKPPMTIKFRKSRSYINWKGRSRGGKLQSEYRYFIDYTDYVNSLPFKRVNRK